MRPGAEIVAQQVADKVGLALDLIPATQRARAHGAKAVNELVTGGGGGVIVVDAAAKDEHVAQEAIGQALRLQPGTAAIQLDVDRLQIDPVLELIEQA